MGYAFIGVSGEMVSAGNVMVDISSTSGGTCAEGHRASWIDGEGMSINNDPIEMLASVSPPASQRASMHHCTSKSSSL